MLSRSYLVRILRRMSTAAGQAFCVYGDPAYPQSDWVSGPYRELVCSKHETDFNLAMSRAAAAFQTSGGLERFVRTGHISTSRRRTNPISMICLVFGLLRRSSLIATRVCTGARRGGISRCVLHLWRVMYVWAGTCPTAAIRCYVYSFTLPHALT